MKYTLQTTKYILKNFFYIFPIALVPAFFLSFTIAREDMLAVWEKVIGGNAQALTFTEIFQMVSIFNFASVETIVFGLAGIVALVVCGALLMAFLDKHMRIGKRTFNGMFARLNENFLPTLGVVTLLFFIYEFWTVLTSALFLFAATLPAPVSYIAAAIVYLGMHFVLLSVVAAIYLWLPCMQITGFKAFEALRYSYILCEPIRWRIIITHAVFLMFAEAVIMASVILLPDSAILMCVVATIFYAVMIMQFCVRMQIAYFDREQIERADLKKYYHLYD